MAQPGLLTRTKIKMDDVRKVAAAKASVQSKMGSFLLGDDPCACTTASLGFVEGIRNGSQVRAFAHRPDGVYERETAPVAPFLAHIAGVSEPGHTSTHGPVADQQHRNG